MSTQVHLLRGDLTETLAQAFRTVPRIAWDIETSGLDWRTDRIGTCQLHAPEVGTVVVQIDDVPPERLRDILAHPEVTKVFHHAAFDLRFLRWNWKTAAESVADTKIASKLLDPHAEHGQHSLKPLLRRYLQVDISKQQQVSDWLAPELTDEQLAYAAADVSHLLPLLELLEARMRTVGLHGLFLECLRFLPTRVELDLNGYPDVFVH